MFSRRLQLPEEIANKKRPLSRIEGATRSRWNLFSYQLDSQRTYPDSNAKYPVAVYCYKLVNTYTAFTLTRMAKTTRTTTLISVTSTVSKKPSATLNLSTLSWKVILTIQSIDNHHNANESLGSNDNNKYHSCEWFYILVVLGGRLLTP